MFVIFVIHNQNWQKLQKYRANKHAERQIPNIFHSRAKYFVIALQTQTHNS